MSLASSSELASAVTTGKRWTRSWTGSSLRRANGTYSALVLIAGRRAVFVFESTKRVQIVIEARDLPGHSCGPSPERPNGHHNVHVGVQRRNRPDELDGLTPGDAPAARWVLDCKATET